MTAYDYIVKYETPKQGRHANEGGLNFFQDQHPQDWDTDTNAQGRGGGGRGWSQQGRGGRGPGRGRGRGRGRGNQPQRELGTEPADGNAHN